MVTGEKQTVRTMCPMNCHPTFCGMLVDIEDGRVTGVRGDPNNPDSKGFLCVRGQATREIPDNPRRILHSRTRAGRDAQEWRDIDWASALDRITVAIQAAGPERVAVYHMHGIIPNTLHRQITQRFVNLGGFQWWNPATVCWGRTPYTIHLIEA